MKKIVAGVFIILIVISFAKTQVNQQWTHSFSYQIDNGTSLVENNALLWIGDTLQPVRGIIITSMTRNEVEFNHDPAIREVMKEEQLAHLFLFREQQGGTFVGGTISTFNISLKHDTLLLYILKNFAVIAGKPEIEHAPWMAFGHSTSGIFAKNLAWWKPERMFGVIFYKTGGYLPPSWLENPDTTAFLNVPWLSVAARIDRYGPGEDGWRIMRQEMMPWRQRGALMNQIVEPTWEEGHSLWRAFNAPFLARFIKNAAQSRIPKDTTARYGPIPLLHMDAAKGVLSDTVISALIDKPEVSDKLLRFHHDTSVEERGRMFWHFDLGSALQWVNYHRKDFDPFVPVRDTIIQGRIDYWNKSIPLGLHESELFEVELIKGVDANGSFSANYTTFADDNGDFLLISYDRLVTMDFNMEGDYHNPVWTQNMLHYINGMDALLLERIIKEDAGFKPGIFQVWAADVNIDGVIDTADLNQLVDRALGNLPEFRQQWNYQGKLFPVISEPSLDWLFYEHSRTRFNPSTRLSRDYPLDDGSGFSRHRIPPASNQTIPPYDIGNPYPVYKTAAFKGIMLGDLDGSFANPLELRSQDHLLNAIIYERTDGPEKSWMVELVPQNSSNKKVLSIDVEISSNNPEFRIAEVKKMQDILHFYHAINESSARILSWNIDGIEHGKVLASIVVGGNDLTEHDLGNINAFVNGVRVHVESFNFTNTGREHPGSFNAKMYPIPACNILNVYLPGLQSETISYKIFNLSGMNILPGTPVHSASNSLFRVDVSGLHPGIYIMEILTKERILREYFVIAAQ